MKNSILFYLLLLPGLMFGQINQKDAKGKKQGVWSKTYPKSKVVEYTGQFKDDKPIGTFVYYYPSSKKKAEINLSIEPLLLLQLIFNEPFQPIHER